VNENPEASATKCEAGAGEFIGPIIYGTDGSGAENLIVKVGGARRTEQPSDSIESVDVHGNRRTPRNLYMNGPEIFGFTLEAVPKAVAQLLARAQMRIEDVDLFIFHQANRHMLEHLRKILEIPSERFYICMKHCGNTVSSTIPIALKHALEEGRLRPQQHAMLVGFGVGYSWAAAFIRV
jgi:3-oxoacyl-[acyl-carrier-protein] synthase-3